MILTCSIERSICIKSKEVCSWGDYFADVSQKAYRLNSSFRSPSDLLQGCKEKAATATSYLANLSFILQIQGVAAEILKACPLQI